MIFNIGYLILIIALLIALFGVVAGFLGGQRRHAGLIQSSFHAVYAVTGLVWIAALILWVRPADRSIPGELCLGAYRKGVAHFLQILRALGWSGGQSTLLDAHPECL